MSLIKGKQIKDLAASKVVETADKKFVSEAQITEFGAKATTEQVDTVATEKSTAALNDAKAYADGKFITEADVDAKIAGIQSAIKYKGTVPTFADIATTYPEPQEGWLVAVEATDKFYYYDADTITWKEIPLATGGGTSTFEKTIVLAVTDGQTVIKTGIKKDGTGVNHTSKNDISLFVNGFLQTPATDYTVAEVDSELEITWKATSFALEASDTLAVTFTQDVK